MFLKGFILIFNKDEGFIYNEKIWLFGKVFEMLIFLICLNSCCVVKKKKLVGFDCLFSYVSILGDIDL